MSARRIKAVLKKQIMNTTNNWGVLLQYILFPAMLFLTLTMIPSEEKNAIARIVISLSVSFAALIPMLTVRIFIMEDQVQNTMRVLILSTVKPLEYLIGVATYTMLLSLLNVLIFGFLGGLSGIAFLKFIGVMMLCVLTTIVYGSALAVFSANRTTSGGLSTLLIIIFGFLPFLGISGSFSKYTSFLYTYQIEGLIGDIYGRQFNWNRMYIVLANLVVFLIIFIFAFRKNKLYKP